MKFRIAALVTALLAAIGMAAGVGVSATPALGQSLGSVKICTTNTSPSACINNTGGSLAAGHALQFWANNAQGATNNSWVVNVIGTVKDGENGVYWPFDVDSELNSRYNGDDVLQFNLNKNTSYCADQGNFAPDAADGVLRLEKCASSTYQDFVLSDYDGNYYLICVGAANLLYSNKEVPDQPIWISAPDGTGNSDLVWMTTNAQLTWEFAS